MQQTSGGGQRALFQAEDAVAPSGELQIVRHEDGRKSMRMMKFVEQVRDNVARSVVEIPGRFVGQQEAGTCGEGSGDHDALLLAAGQFAGAVVRPRAETHLAKAFLGLCQRGRARHAADEERHHHVFWRQ